jgi:hypothetical protein
MVVDFDIFAEELSAVTRSYITLELNRKNPSYLYFETSYKIENC